MPYLTASQQQELIYANRKVVGRRVATALHARYQDSMKAAEELGTSAATLRKIRRGEWEVISLETLMKLAYLLQIDVKIGVH